jgi:hypothetical protein
MLKVINVHCSLQNIDTATCVEAVGNKFNSALIARARGRKSHHGHAGR